MKPVVSALNVYKKVAVIRRETDSLNYEDAEGNVRTVSDLGVAASTATPSQAANKAKIEIPVPQIKMVETYDKDIPSNYDIKSSFVRYHRPSRAEWMESIEYIADLEDETWLQNNAKFGSGEGGSADLLESTSLENATVDGAETKPSSLTVEAAIANSNEGTPNRQQLPLPMFEHMMDVLEKATGFDFIVSTSQAEQLLQEKVPGFTRLFPPKSGRASAASGIVTAKQVVTDVYNYWVQKRSKLKRPLLRCYWPVTSTEDTNPHLVFRPREKEKYKLRKTRRNDMVGFNKMKQLRNDFDNLRMALDLVRKREELYRVQVRMQCEWFEQKLFDITDTSGKPRKTAAIKKREIDTALDIPTYFDITSVGTRRGKRGRKLTTGSRSVSPVPTAAGGSAAGLKLGDAASGAGTPSASSGATPAAAGAAPRNVAGQNFGQPAPCFLDPLQTRESYVTSWDRAVPHVTSYIESHALPTHRFRHRPRVGRGGRLNIDRLPCPSHPDITPMTFFTAGMGLMSRPRDNSKARSSASTASRQEQPPTEVQAEPVDHRTLSLRIEELSASALQEEMELATGELPATEDNSTADMVLVKMDKYLQTDDQLWGDERFAIGPV